MAVTKLATWLKKKVDHDDKLEFETNFLQAVIYKDKQNKF
jgi:hypothetical protein